MRTRWDKRRGERREGNSTGAALLFLLPRVQTPQHLPLWSLQLLVPPYSQILSSPTVARPQATAVTRAGLGVSLPHLTGAGRHASQSYRVSVRADLLVAFNLEALSFHRIMFSKTARFDNSYPGYILTYIGSHELAVDRKHRNIIF